MIIRDNIKVFGGIAQLGERFAGSEEVIGSNPIISIVVQTMKGRRLWRLFYFL